MMSRAPASAASTSGTWSFRNGGGHLQAARSSLPVPAGLARIACASGSSPRSRAIAARGLALGLVGPVEVLQRLQRGRGVQLGRQLVGQLALRVDLGLDGLAALGQLAQVLQPRLDLADLHLVQPAGDLLAVAGDEGDRVAVVEELDRGGDLG